MRLTYTCSICKKQNYLRDKAVTRPDLQMKVRSDEVRVNCSHCGKIDKKHINRVDAVVDSRVNLIGLTLGGISTVLVWQIGFIAAFTFAIPIFFWRHEMDKASRFNKTLISRKNA